MTLDVVRFTDRGLGNDAYLIIAGNTAVALDPARDVRPYLESARDRRVRIMAVLETHLHADFVSGARQLAAGGATIYASDSAGLEFPYDAVADGEKIELDGMTLTSIATPGHSPEHLAYLVDGDPPVLFSGGALIPGGAARTDLLGEEHTVEFARALYRTLHERLAELPDETVVHPTHGGGSFCSTGSGASAGGGDRSTTLGFERKHNPLFQADSEEAFVETLVSGYGLFPPYFLRLREVNRRGPRLLEGPPSPPRLQPAGVKQELEKGAWLVDVRQPERYAAGHVRGSVAVPPDQSFAVRLGWVVPFGTRLILVTEGEEDANKASIKAAGIGYEDIAGWTSFEPLRVAGLPVSETPLVDAQELASKLEDEDPPTVVDVRNPPEWEDGTLPGALTVEFGALRDEIPRELRRGPLVTYCASGARAALAASLLERSGVEDVSIFRGGPDEWRASGLPLKRP